MSLKDDIKQAIDDSRDDWFTFSGDSCIADTQVLTDKVWATLEGKLGPVQEKLMNDLQNARTQRDQAVGRENALRETVAQQAAELDHLRRQSAGQ